MTPNLLKYDDEHQHHLEQVHSVRELLGWMMFKGLSPGENAIVGPVHLVHTYPTSWHYQKWNKKTKRMELAPVAVVLGKSVPQGRAGIDLNDNDLKDDGFRQVKLGKFKNEADVLNHVYDRIAAVARKENWPLAEMFFADRGYKRASGWGVNVQVPNHDDHWHGGFYLPRW